MFHAIVIALSNNSYSDDDHHIALFTNYLSLLVSALQTAYPAMAPGDAKGLVLNGLIAKDGGESPKARKWSTSFVDKILSYSGHSRAQVAAVYKRYQQYHISGTRCN